MRAFVVSMALGVAAIGVAVPHGRADEKTHVAVDELLIDWPDPGYVPGKQVPRLTLIKWLRQFEPLPKVHYSWSLPVEMLNNPRDALLNEYVRLTRAASISARWATRGRVRTAVQVCKQVNAANPATPATLAICYSPWTRAYKPKGSAQALPPTQGGGVQKEAERAFRDDMDKVKRWIAEANGEDNVVRVSALIYNCECWMAKKGDRQHPLTPQQVEFNRALDARYNWAYDEGRRIFGDDVLTIWYSRGSVCRNLNADDGWSHFGRFTLKEKGDVYCCSLYHLPEIGYTRECFRRTYELAQDHKVEHVVPWVALGSGYPRNLGSGKFLAGWDYNPIYSFELGLDIHKRGDYPRVFAPWNAAPAVVLYPSPFHKDARYFGKHLVAYLLGAHNIRKAPIEEEPLPGGGTR